jgi:hypothetical protein
MMCSTFDIVILLLITALIQFLHMVIFILSGIKCSVFIVYVKRDGRLSLF